MPSTPSETRCIDLHSHTIASDGDHTPTQLLERAARIGLKAIAITDHDTTDGVPEAKVAGELLGVEVVSGIELSAEPPKQGQCHILGLLIDERNSALLNRLKEVVTNRNLRNSRIVEKMQRELGWDIELSEVEAEAGGDIIARPHFAKLLVKKNLAPDVKTAFDVYLGTGGKAYVSRDRLSAEEAIRLIHGAGGVAILAHPNNFKYENFQETVADIERLIALGLDGIEARYNLHTPEETIRYLELAQNMGILTSGGSDFHGETVKKLVLLGSVEGDRPAPLLCSGSSEKRFPQICVSRKLISDIPHMPDPR